MLASVAASRDLDASSLGNRTAPKGSGSKLTLVEFGAPRGDQMKPGVLDKVKAALEKGLTISAITASGRPIRLLKHNALARHRRENPDFDRFVSELTKDNISRGHLLRRQRIRNAAVREVRRQHRAQWPSSPDRIGCLPNR
jgi:hypothetical protein